MHPYRDIVLQPPKGYLTGWRRALYGKRDHFIRIFAYNGGAITVPVHILIVRVLYCFALYLTVCFGITFLCVTIYKILFALS